MAAILGNGIGAQPIGPLTGKIVYAAAGHGLTATSAGVWRTQRGETNEIVEDFGNYDQLTLYADELWRAGATVVPMRPVGHQLNEVIVDNTAATFTGTWSDGASTPYFSTSNGSGVKYRSATAAVTETAVARFAPNLPAAGEYPVYTWALDGGNRLADQLYRVNHAGGSTEVRINHQRVGKGWVYLGTYRFRAGEAGSVEVSNKSTQSVGGAAIADAIRFGNGMGSVVRNGFTSGSAREDEASLYWIEAQAGWTGVGTRVPSSEWRTLSDDGDANVGAPLRWSAYMNAAPFGQSVYLSFHSNAFDGTARGTDGLYNNDTTRRTTNQVAWARLVGNEINDDLVALGTSTLEFPFQNTADPIFGGVFGEIRSDVNGNEFDATIIETAFHDNAQDAAIMRDPRARQRIAQSTAQATIRYFNQYGTGTPIAFLPERPTNLRTRSGTDGNVVLTWNASITSSIYGGAPTGYRVYASRDGYSFDGGQAVTGTTLTIPKAAIGSGTAYFKVVATNAGGESPATAVVAARVGDTRMGRILIVDGFDRLTRAQNVRQSIAISGVNSGGNIGGVVTIDRVRPRSSNSFDYAIHHAQAIANHPGNIGFDTVDNLAVINGNVNLANYRAVIWMSGEESTVDRTFSAQEQAAVSTYLGNGGKVFVSGSELGWDLVESGNGQSFLNSTLRAGYVSDDAGTYNASGVSSSIFAGVSLSFDNGTGSTYDVDFADRLAASNGSTALLNYSGGLGGVAATRWAGTNGAATIVMGFPFETITSGAVRASLMRKALDSFGFNTLAPTVGRTRIITTLPEIARTELTPLPFQPQPQIVPQRMTSTQTLTRREDDGSIIKAILA